MSKLSDLLDYCSKNNIKVTFSDSRTLHDYAGMNPQAAKAIGFKNIDSNEIILDRNQTEDIQYKNLVHELTEKHLMDQGSKYWPAHVKALKTEKHSPPKFNFI